jgi:hypothetical protein
VSRVLDRWRTPAGPAFRVEVEDGLQLDLCYDQAVARWKIREV